MIDEFLQSKLLIELYVSCHASEELIRESRSIRAHYLLNEQVTIDNLSQHVKDNKKEYLKIVKFFDDLEATDLAKELTRLVNDIPDPTKLSTAIFSDNETDVKNLAKVFTTKMQIASMGFASVMNSIKLMHAAVEPYFEKLSEDDMKLTIGELTQKAKTESSFKDNFITPEKLDAGLKKSFVPDDNFKKRVKLGSQAAASSAGSSAKSSLGKMFGSAFKFLTGFFAIPPEKNFPRLLAAFKTYINSVTFEDLSNLAKRTSIQSQGGKILLSVAQDVSNTNAEIAAVAAGADPVKKADGGGEKVKIADLETKLGGDENAKAFVTALKGNESTKELFEGSKKLSLRTILFESVSYQDLLAIAKNTKGIDEKEAIKLATVTTKYLKSKGADVDDSDVPQEKSENDADVKKQISDDIAVAANKAETKQVDDTIASVIRAFTKAFNQNDKMKSSIEKLRIDLRDFTAEQRETITRALKMMFEEWFSKLPQEERDKFSPNNVKAASAAIEKVINSNFKFEGKKNTYKSQKLNENIQLQRWQRLAGIK